MNLTKNNVAVMLAGVLGTGVGLMPATASAVLSDGNWALTIVPTPTFTTSYGSSFFKVGSDGNWNSGFSYGDPPSQSSLLGMTDNGTLLAGGKGSSIGGDGFAGIIEMNVSGGNITVPGTNMTGSVDGLGNMTFDPAGRLGLFDAFPASTDLPFYIDDFSLDASGNPISNGNTTWSTFTTGLTSALFTPFTTPQSINGSALTNAGDLDGDGIDDFQGILVSGGNIGSQWGSFFGVGYYETWRIEMLSGTSASGFNVDSVFGGPGGSIAQYTSAVPIPAALYLFGSGLVGLLGVTRRKKT